MLNVQKEQKANMLILRLSGTLDETDNLNQLLGEPAGPVTVYSRGVTRINSIGIKNWIKYFSALAQKQIPVTFEEFAIPFVEQVNMVQNFACGGQIASIAMPLLCQSCEKGMVGVMRVEVIKKANFEIPPAKCPQCGGNAVFDDIPEEYFAFLQS